MIALLYDIHGNLAALEAVVADAGDVDGYVIGGDVALFGPWPAETVGRVRELENSRPLRGNGERWAANPSEAPDAEPVPGAIAALVSDLGDVIVRGMALLPESVELEDGTRCWHGSPVSDVRSFLPEPADDEDELLAGVDDRRLIFGHTHVPFVRTSASGIELVNPGSVGMPFDGDPRAAYALLHDDGRIEHRRVAYDHRASAAAMAERYGDAEWAQIVARRIETARV
jgi:diadenosine tetraphosphatase ApaH/serine/threonine PP2A family protein phosphatase